MIRANMSRKRRAAVADLTGLVIIGGLLAPHTVLAGPIANTLNQRANAAQDNPGCATLTGRLHKHAVSLYQLRTSIDKDAAGPAPSISGVVKNWLGQSYTSASLKKKRDRYDAEMREAKELEGLGHTIGCEAFDIEEAMRAEAAKHPLPGAH